MEVIGQGLHSVQLRALGADVVVKSTVLLISDSPYVRLRIRSALQSSTMDVIETGTLRDAAYLFSLTQPHAVVLDTDGASLETQGIRAIRLFMATAAGARLVVVSALASASILRAAREHGARGFIVKPVDPLRVRQVVTNIMRAPVRQYQRAPVALNSSAKFERFGPRFYSCLTGDLSPGGARFILPSSPNGGDPEIGSKGELHIDLDDGKGPVSLDGYIARAIQPGELGFYFRDLSGPETARIEAICQRTLQNRGYLDRGPESRSALAASLVA